MIDDYSFKPSRRKPIRPCLSVVSVKKTFPVLYLLTVGDETYETVAIVLSVILSVMVRDLNFVNRLEPRKFVLNADKTRVWTSGIVVRMERQFLIARNALIVSQPFENNDLNRNESITKVANVKNAGTTSVPGH